jgi:monofunctional biosynthetic peptidoglycan transglycosylase
MQGTDSPGQRRAPAPGRGRRWTGTLRTSVAVVLLGALVLLAAFVAWEALTWPDVAALASANPRTTAFIERYEAERRAEGESVEVAWQWVSYDRISANLKRAVLVGEDINFFSHGGFDTFELSEALKEGWEEKELPRGASTITQQLAKNLWLSPSRNPFRKLKEALLTRQLESDLGKRRIFELYLNVVEFGPGIYGAEAAAHAYFGIPAAALDEEQAAELAAGLPKPSHWHPGGTSRVYRARVARILRRMERATFLRHEI